VSEHPTSIAERFLDGFMHPELEQDAERLARGYMALEARNDRLCELLQRIYDNERVWRVLPNSIAAEMFAEMNVDILDEPRKQASAGRSSGEAVSPDRERE
jgi:hypothetical protein